MSLSLTVFFTKKGTTCTIFEKKVAFLLRLSIYRCLQCTFYIDSALFDIFTLNCFVLSEFKIQSCAFPLPLKLKVKYLLA